MIPFTLVCIAIIIVVVLTTRDEIGGRKNGE